MRTPSLTRSFGVRPLGSVAFAFSVILLQAVQPHAGEAQDVEMAGLRNGVPVPAAYYQRIAADPSAFQLPNGLFRHGAAPWAVHAIEPAVGAHRVPVVLALFSDSEEPTFTREMVQAALFDGPAPRGTVTESYEEMSMGVFSVRGDVIDWVRTSKTEAEVAGTQNGLGEDADLGSYFTEALSLTDGATDFGVYDNDGPDGVPNSGDDDGFVDALVFEYLEPAGSCGAPGIWPHRWGIGGVTGEGPFVTDDERPGGGFVQVDGYITQSVSDCTGANLQSAEVIAHEYGHVLGLPDYYHWIDRSLGPRGRRWVLGCWALMAAGSWGCGEVEEDGVPRAVFGPSHMGAWSKFQLGWVDLVDVGEVWNEEIVLEPIQTSGQGLRIPLDDAGAEFLIAEYRGLVGFDRELPAGGVLFYKQDLTASLRPAPESGAPYYLGLLEQDDDDGLLRMAVEGGNRGEPGDAWGLGGPGKLTYHSAPSLRLSAGGYASAMVHEVRVADGRATIVLSTGRTPRLVAPVDPVEVMQVRSFSVPVRIAGGTGPYTGVGDLPEGFGFSSVGDELTLEGWVPDAGPHSFTFAVRDGSGQLSQSVSVDVYAPIAWVAEEDQLLQVFLDPSGAVLTAGERLYLDDVGNGNGRYDVGDLRRWMKGNR